MDHVGVAPGDRQTDPAGARLRRVLAQSPSLPLLLVAVAVFAWLAADEGGFRGTTSLPATLLLLALLAVGLVALPLPRPSRARWAAIGLLAGYAAWSYLSIVWADQQGLAWDGANRTLTYAIAFALFALWRIEGRAALAVLAAYTLAVAGIGAVELARIAASSDPMAFFDEGRLSEPTGYVNANVALWSAALWPAIVLAGRRAVPWPLRGAFLGSAVILASLAVLGQSRGWVLLIPATALVAVAIVPGRGRTIAAGGLVAFAVAVIAGPLLRVYDELGPDTDPSQLIGPAARAAVIAGLLAAAVGAGWGALDRSRAVAATTSRQLGKAIVAGFAILCVAGLGAFAAAQGNPVGEATDAWAEFREGGSEPSFEGSRIGTFGGTYRYDYWTVAWGNFTEQPLLGVGADNFGRDYLIEGQSQQTPTHPHSVELRTLSQTGLIGFLLLFGSVAAALFAATRPLRRAEGSGAVAAATALVAFAYFLLHASIDWLWAFPGLAAPAFALLGLATATAARPSAGPGARPPLAAIVVAALLALAAVGSLTVTWLAERDLRHARTIAGSDPAAALARLDRASQLNPLSPLADKTAAVVERRQGRFGAAERRLRSTLAHDPDDPFVFLELAVLASATDRPEEALGLIRRARALNPRDRVTRRVQSRLRAGRRVSPAWVDRLIVEDVRSRTGAD